MPPPPPVAYAAVRSMVVVLLVLIPCLLLFPLWGAVFVPCLLCSVLCFFFLVLQSLGGSSWLLYHFVFLAQCDCYCSVALPHGDMGWSHGAVGRLVVCDCGIS